MPRSFPSIDSTFACELALHSAKRLQDLLCLGGSFVLRECKRQSKLVSWRGKALYNLLHLPQLSIVKHGAGLDVHEAHQCAEMRH